MKAVALTHYLPIDDPNSLMDVELGKPEPTGRDLLVATKAIAVNPVDYKVRAPKDKIEESPNGVAEWIDEGRIQCTASDVTSPINATNLRAAHASLEAGRSIGKIVLKDWA